MINPLLMFQQTAMPTLPEIPPTLFGALLMLIGLSIPHIVKGVQIGAPAVGNLVRTAAEKRQLMNEAYEQLSKRLDIEREQWSEERQALTTQVTDANRTATSALNVANQFRDEVNQFKKEFEEKYQQALKDSEAKDLVIETKDKLIVEKDAVISQKDVLIEKLTRDLELAASDKLETQKLLDEVVAERKRLIEERDVAIRERDQFRAERDELAARLNSQAAVSAAPTVIIDKVIVPPVEPPKADDLPASTDAKPVE